MRNVRTDITGIHWTVAYHARVLQCGIVMQTHVFNFQRLNNSSVSVSPVTLGNPVRDATMDILGILK